MNELSGIATPLVEMPWFLGMVALAAFAAGWSLIKTVSADYWGSNRVLYCISLGNQALGRVIAPIPGIVCLLIACYFAIRAIGFW